MSHSQGSIKRQRIATTPSKVTDLTNDILKHYFSFLGKKTGCYYFLASVCKDFKALVEEQYGDDRNTSADSILSSKSTCFHVSNILDQDPTDNVALQKRNKIVDPIFA
ncbi:predicted protein [Chaetoceros tenuissimus]|uniref:Uncharacterized protein n=1 Tax=Chaetoceros tenuissimus TaxID=426638 RepID=A0AAD3D5M1_9STRA|nr:predicted protein [Chaetoceros tenuissimus]